MFDLSFAEIAIIFLVAIIFIGPKDVPVVVRAVARFVRTLKGWAREIRAAFDDMAKESGLKDMADEFEGDVRMIRGDDGKWYESYDVDAVIHAKAGIQTDEKNDTATKPEQVKP